MSIAVGNLPLPHRRRFKNLTPRRCRTAVIWKAKPTAPLPQRTQMKFTAAAPHRHNEEKKVTAAAPPPRRY